MNRPHDHQLPPLPIDLERFEHGGALPYLAVDAVAFQSLHDQVVRLAQQVEALAGHGGSDRPDHDRPGGART